MINGLIDWIRAEEWHHDRLHQQFERDPESDAGGDGSHPAPRPHVTDLAPWRMRPPGPHEHQNGAERKKDRISRGDKEYREDSKRPESSELGGERIAGG